MPQQCLSPKFDELIGSAVDDYWRDFHAANWWKAQLCAESHLDPAAVSAVGAEGLAQIMPNTYAEVVRQLHWDSALTAHDPERAIRAGAYYQGNMRRAWKPDGRTGADRNRLGNAAYNAGTGSILKAQRACGDARLWEEISPCMAQITGPQFSRETLTYVDRITGYAAEIKVRK